jgi:hypothetical protein
MKQINHVPVLLANRDAGPYPATYRQPHGGAFASAGVAWLQWQLKGDAQARRSDARTWISNCTLHQA